MPLDPQAKAVLDQFASMGGPPLHEMSVAQARELILGMVALAGEPESIARIENRTVPGPAGEIPIRIYTPVGTAPFPVLVYFHGGGWVIGDIETHDVLCRQLTAEAGVAVVSVDYRLAPEHKFPASVDDAWAATRWVASHADELGVDARRLSVGGDSAGGNLAAVVALLARDAGAPAIALQVLVYPVTDLGAETKSYADLADGYMLTRDSMRWFRAQYLAKDDDALDWRVSPIRATSLAGLPPALVITAGFDPLRDEGEAYARRLREAGVSVDAVCFGGLIHGFVPMGRLIDTAFRAVTLIAGSLRQALR